MISRLRGFSLRATLLLAGVGASTAAASSWSHHSPSAAFVHDVAALGYSGTVVAATSGGLYRSADDGDSWTWAADLPRTGFHLVAADPSDPDHVYAAGGSIGLFRSADGGVHWSPIGGTLPGGGKLPESYIYAVEIDPVQPSILWVSLAHGLYKSTDHGDSWTLVGEGLPLGIPNFAIDPVAGTLYALSGREIYRSSDSGVTWIEIPRPATEDRLSFIIADENAVYVDTAGGMFFRTSNDGATWISVPHPASNLAHIRSHVVDRSTGFMYVGTEEHGVFRWVDVENRWEQVGTETFGAMVTALAFGNGLFTGTSGHGVFRSSDDGTTWLAASSPIDTASIQALAFDPSSPQTLYAGAFRGLFRTRNGGRSWTLIGLSDSQIVTLSVAADVMTVGTWDDGVFRSIDRGVSWQKIGGKNASGLSSVVVDPHDSRRLLATSLSGFLVCFDGETWDRGYTGSVTAATFDPMDSQTILISTGSSILRSSSGGGFAPFGTPPAGNLNAFLTDPHDSTRIYATTSNGLWVSEDRGQTWSLVDDRIKSAYGHAFESPSVMYIADGHGYYYKSAGGGRNWGRIDALGEGVAIVAIAVAPRLRNTWLGSAAGVFRPVTWSRRRSVRH
jgi:photosystem II stability/assembly factor-like uncharacterized protein